MTLILQIILLPFLFPFLTQPYISAITVEKCSLTAGDKTSPLLWKLQLSGCLNDAQTY